jgi:multicomponent Na+:H+ antiporter subunit A
MTLNAAVLAGYVLAAFAPSVHRANRRRSGSILALLPAALLVYFVSLAPAVAGGERLQARYAWVPSLGVQLSFVLDGLSLLFALLITSIGALVLVYASRYLEGHAHLGRFYALLLTFMASMLGLVLADNLILMFVFWELTSVSSYFLIGFEHQRDQARRAALQALLVTALGGLALLTGFLLLARAGGSFELSVLLSRGETLRSHPTYPVVLLLILLGAFTKSAQCPFHFWLPSAMEAPTPVSAYLHSATMVNAGVFLLARLSPGLSGTAFWLIALTATGAVTMLVGAVRSLRETDLKRILAYSTVSILGVLTFLAGIATEAAAKALVAVLLAHALYKGALFLIAGAVDHETGARDIKRLGGLWKSMPISACAALLAGLSMAGAPPLFGFLAKEMTYQSILQVPGSTWVLMTAAVVTNMFLFAAAASASLAPFFGRSRGITPKRAHEAPLALWIGPSLLAGAGFLLGIMPGAIEELSSAAAGAAYGKPLTAELALGHGPGLALILSCVTLAGGIALYLNRAWVVWLTGMPAWGTMFNAEIWYERCVFGMIRAACMQTAALQNGYLRNYVLTIVVTTVGLIGYSWIRQGVVVPQAGPFDARLHEIVLAAVIVVAALAAVRSESLFGAVAAIGVVGLGNALIFVMFGAPDLALTQFLVETLTVILLALVLYHLPAMAKLTRLRLRVRDAVVAVAAGGIMTALVLTAVSYGVRQKISTYFVENSYPLAHGRNVVNVILVDFRGLDTLGEITVLAVAGIGVYALLRLRKSRPEDE